MPTVDPKLFEIAMSGTPERVTPAIASLCRDVSPGHEPIYVDVAPDPEARPSECFPNVRARVARDGGEILYGWVIWEWRRVFIEAEHHAVWLSEGRMLDITPHVPPSTRVLFLPDPDRAYDFVTERRLQNRRQSLDELPMASAWVEAANDLWNYVEASSQGRTINMSEARFTALRDRMAHLQAAIFVALAASTKRNDPCFCGGGRKFKVCCSRLIDMRV